jgi:aconitate decarboxylase
MARHITSTVGSIGAAVAVGKLLKLDTIAMQHAIGLAATQVIGLREMFGSHTKSFHPGRAAQSGLMAAVLASNGYTSSLQALEAKRGWANVVSVSNNLDEQMDSLGKVWEITKNAYKPFPCGIVVHPVIDGCIQLHQELHARRVSVPEVKSVHVKVHPLVLELTGKKTPQDGLQAKFSVFHGGAIGLVLGKAGPAQYEDELILSDEIVSVRDKIEAAADGSLAADETYIILTLKDGTTLEKHVSHALGSLEVPMTDAQLEEKFIDQCLPVLGAIGAQQASKSCWGLEGSSDVRQIAKSI